MKLDQTVCVLFFIQIALIVDRKRVLDVSYFTGIYCDEDILRSLCEIFLHVYEQQPLSPLTAL